MSSCIACAVPTWTSPTLAVVAVAAAAAVAAAVAPTVAAVVAVAVAVTAGVAVAVGCWRLLLRRCSRTRRPQWPR